MLAHPFILMVNPASSAITEVLQFGAPPPQTTTPTHTSATFTQMARVIGVQQAHIKQGVREGARTHTHTIPHPRFQALRVTSE